MGVQWDGTSVMYGLQESLWLGQERHSVQYSH